MMKQDSVKLKIENENQKSKAEKMTKVQTWSLASLYCSERFVYKITEKMQYTIRCKLFSTTFLTPEELSYSEELCSTVYYDIAWFQTKN